MHRAHTKAAALVILLCVLGGCPRREKKASPTPAPAAKEQKKTKEKLAALPYLNWVPVKDEEGKKSSVTVHRPELTSPGLNFYNSRPRHEALLMDMQGKILHRWKSGLDQPGVEERTWSKVWGHFDFAGWHHSELRPDGSVMAIVHYQSVIKLDWDSRVLWSAKLPAHHDLDVADNGEVYVLDARVMKLKQGKRDRLFLDNGIVVLSPDGKERRRHSLFELLSKAPRTREFMARTVRESLKIYDEALNSGYEAAAKMAPALNLSLMATQLRMILDGKFSGSRRTKLMFLTGLYPIDLLHANSLEIIREDAPGGMWKAGDLLISLRTPNMVVVLDPKAGKVRWTWGPGQVLRQHQPTVVEGDRVLLFDNGEESRGSRILEVDPRNDEVVWRYEGKKPADFFSIIRGGVQRLPNGNTLITDSESGRAFEVTKAGQTVWEYYNPDLSVVAIVLLRAPIYRMSRFPPSQFKDRLGAPSPPSPSPKNPQ